MPQLSGQEFGRYHILEQLGEGGMASVYKAYDARLERHVAIKVILPQQAQSEQFMKRFEREAKALARLTHPNIVPIMDYGEHEHMLYLVMAYIPGGTLRDRMHSALAWDQSARLLVPVASALQYAHQHGIIHRDVKPANILIMESGQPMLSDFGIAKIIEGQNTQLTGTGVGLGTPDYMAPELGQGLPVDARSDLYALGVVYYEMVTGHKPFHADTPLAVLIKHITEPLPRPRSFIPDLPESVEALIFKALAKNPDDRYQDMGAFQSALENLAFRTAPESSAVPTPMQVGEGELTTSTTAAAAPLPATQAVQAAGNPAQERTPAHSPPSSATAPSIPRPAGHLPVVQQKKGLPGWVFVAGGAGLLGGCALLALVIWSLLKPNPAPLQASSQQVRITETSTPAALETGEGQAAASETPLPIPTATASIASVFDTNGFASADPSRLVVYSDVLPYSLDPLSFGNTWVSGNVCENLVTFDHSSAHDFIPQLAEDWQTSADGLTVTFTMRQGVTFHEGGQLSAGDAAYSLQRQVLIGTLGQDGLSRAILEPAYLDITYLVDDTGALAGDQASLAQADPAALQAACQAVKDAITADDANRTVTLHLVQPFPALLSMLASPLSSILDKEWVVSQGGWDGSCSTWQDFYAEADNNTSVLTGIANGTGPFELVLWDQAGGLLSLRRNTRYWRSEPAWQGAPSGAAELAAVEVRQASQYDSVLAGLTSGEIDLFLFPSAGDLTLQDPAGEDCVYTFEDGGLHCEVMGTQPLREIRQLPSATGLMVYYTFDIQVPPEGNPYIGSGQLDGQGIPQDFFNDEHIRKAFNYCLDEHSVAEALGGGEYVFASSMALAGMAGFELAGAQYDFDLQNYADEFKQSGWSGLWETGFYFQIPVRVGTITRRLILENLAANLLQVNERFRVEVVDDENYGIAASSGLAPMNAGGWASGYYDADSFYYGLSWFFAPRQRLPQDILSSIDEYVTAGLNDADWEYRQGIYRSLNPRLYELALMKVVWQPTNRILSQRWVDGLYYNPALGALDLYTIWKH